MKTKYKPGDVICFKKDIYEFPIRVTRDLFPRAVFIKAHEPVTIVKITRTMVRVKRKDGECKSLRNIPERMYPNTKLGRAIYAD